MSTTDTGAAAPAIDEARLEAFLGGVVSDMAAAGSTVLAMMGDRLGLYRAMAGAGPLTSAELAARAGCAERYVRKWLSNQAAGGYVEYDPATGRFTLPAEHAMVLADPASPAFVGGGLDILECMAMDAGRIQEAFRTGEGMGWGEHHHSLFCGTERFFRTGYEAHLVQEWIPALDGVAEKLQAGGSAADVGCGHGVSTVVLGRAFPEATIVGFDFHGPSIEQARQEARDAGVDRVSFEVATAQDFPGEGYDLVCTFDCLHDMGDPVGAARRIRETIDDDGTWLLVEPFAGDRLEDNLNPVGRLFYAASTMICTANALSQDGGMSLGAQAGEERLRDVAQQAGFTRVRRAMATPFNLILEVRP